MHARSQGLCAIRLRVVNETGKAIAQKQLAPVGFGFRQQGKKNIPHLCRNFFHTKNLKRLSEIETFRD